jgi:thiol-disulfide isomerase/thioredoxin
MPRFMARFRLLLLFVAVGWPSAAMATDLPTAGAILEIHRANRRLLSDLHLQLVHSEERTEAYCRQAQRRADELEKVDQLVAAAKSDDVSLTVEGKVLRGAEAQPYFKFLTGPEVRQQIKSLRAESKPVRFVHPMEFFLWGASYQFRQPAKWSPINADVDAWEFPDETLSAESLVTTYADVCIYSRTTETKPAARWWSQSVDRHAYITGKHLGELMSVKLPPFSDQTQPLWDRRHPFDAFFSQPADRYRVVRQETINGRLLTVVDVAVPIASDSTTLLSFRGWLDLERGALPIKLFYIQSIAELSAAAWDQRPPREIITTHEVRELPNGGLYPATTVAEEWSKDPDAADLTEAEWAKVRAGLRANPLVVHRRRTWACSVVEIPTALEDNFFVIPFPAGQKLFDHDAGKMIGALEPRPLVKIGQPAPPLTVAHWLDGRSRTLDDQRGQVVVLDFWGLWCGACRQVIPDLKSLQEKFADRPVTFVSVHTADGDSAELAKRITNFNEASGWQFLAAIDSGTMIEDSATTNAYGIQHFPSTVIIGPDGKVIYAEPDIGGPNCDEDDPEVLAEFEAKFNGVWKAWFEAVDETWPIADDLSESERQALFQRVHQLYLAKQIETALRANGGAAPLE